jgi:hypothetical protein
MRRIIDTTQSKKIGKCIYCGETQGKLSDEHVAPYALNGRCVLIEASCKQHSNITSALETKILSDMLFAARAALSTRTRHKKDRAKPRPMRVERAGQIETINAVWQDHWKIIQLPIFPPPACIDCRPYVSGIECISMDTFELSEKGEDIAHRHNADKVLPPEYSPTIFARFVAKMAYGYAVERYGLEGFESVHVLPAVLGESEDIGRWVGCSDRRELPVRQCIISVGFKIMEENDLVVKIKLFSQFDGAEYVVVVGRVTEASLKHFQALGLQG